MVSKYDSYAVAKLILDTNARVSKILKKKLPGMNIRVRATFLKKFFPESLFSGAHIKYLSAFT